MNKLNKKGFTLIEMLVVIAIIAVLVSIIIPTVTSATDKAGAATNAANLRAVVAEATTKYLTNDETAGNVTLDFTNGALVSITVNATAPYSAKCGSVAKNTPMTVAWDGLEFHASYGNYDVESFAAVAGGDKAPAEIEAMDTVQWAVTGQTGTVVTGTGAAKS